MGQPIRIDLRFAEIPYEILLLEEYLKLIENNLDHIRKRELDRIDSDFYKEGDEAQRQMGFHLRGRLENGITTRFLTAAGTIAIWGIFEAAVVRMSEYARAEGGQVISLDDLRGGFLDKSNKYFEDVLGLPLVTEQGMLAELERIATIRHASAHGNGRLADLRKKQRRQVEAMATGIDGLNVSDGYLVIEMEWLWRAQRTVREVVEGLRDRVLKRFPLSRNDRK